MKTKCQHHIYMVAFYLNYFITINCIIHVEFRRLVVCISGVTCGGKSTITKLLHQRVNGSVVIKQDDYYLEDDDPMQVQLPELQWRNRELVAALDMTQMRKDIEDVVCRMGFSMPVLILDGFLLYYDEYITSLCDFKLFFLIGKELCKERRKRRNKRVKDIDSYFEHYIWPAYLKYRDISFNKNPDMILVNGGIYNHSILERIITFIKPTPTH